MNSAPKGTTVTDTSSAASPTTGPRPATMADVAQRVGVSRQLVGLVFRNAAGVGSDTRAKILEAARVLGYSPNTAARALRAGSTKYIGVIFDPAHSAPVEIIEWLYTFARESGYRLVVSALTPIRDEREAITEIVGHRCEALILIAPRSSPELLRRVAGQIPIVVIGRGIPDSEFDIVRSQGDSGIDSVVVHLASLGHAEIVYVHGVDMLDGELRLAGYRAATKRLALAENILEVRGDYTEECGANAARILLAGEALPTAIVCSNDQAALGLSHTLAAAGVRIPADVSITGFDDSRVARLSFMNLTTVRQDPREVGEAAIAAAISRITGTGVTGTEVFTSARLVVRGSTAVPSRPPASF